MIAIAAILIIAVVMSLMTTTKESRLEAARKLAAWNPWFLIGTGILWALMLWHPPP